MKTKNIQSYIYFLASVIFCYGFLLVLINGYYHYTYLEFLDMKRKDLIVRLGFLSYIFGSLYFPTVLVPIIFLTWSSMKTQGLNGKSIWFYSLSAIFFVGLLFYTQKIEDFIYMEKESWFLGLVLIGLAMSLYWNKYLLKRIKTQHTTKDKEH